MVLRQAYIVAARRTALGRLGGLHRSRRVEDLASPVIAEALKDAGLSSARVDRVVIGNALAGGNPARLLVLTSGLPEQVPAMTIDQQCASGLSAVLEAARAIATGDADVVVTGGVEALSMAPWRLAKPRAVHQTPRFIGLSESPSGPAEGTFSVEAGEALAARLGLTRSQQDDYALRSHMKAGLARDAKQFVREIVALKNSAEEGRDQSAVEPELDDLADQPPLIAGGTLTSGNTAVLHDGAAIVIAVSEAVWSELGKPAALRLALGTSIGVSPAEEIDAPVVALQRMLSRAKLKAEALGVVEMSEQSSVQALALRQAMGLADEVLNPAGGAIVRGHPLAAAGAVLAVRLFSSMVRQRSDRSPKLGAAVLGASGGQGVAALFEAV